MKLAAIGSNCVDYYQNMNGGTAFPGGGPVNMAVYTVRLGGKASYIGPVGNDEFGHVMYDAIKSKGVDVSHFQLLLISYSSLVFSLFVLIFPEIINW